MANKVEKEIRSLDLEVRLAEDSRHIDGYSAVFNSRSHNLGGFVEVIAPSAFDGVLERSDVKLLLNHNEERGILGRSKKGTGSLKLEVDDKGLRFETEAPKTTLGDEALEYLRRGDATQCSFAFTVADGGDRWEKEADGTYLRTIEHIERLFDCSILTCTPAYEATSVSCRSFEEFKEKEEAARLEEERLQKEKEEQEQREAEEEKKKQLEEYYKGIKETYKDYLKKED